MPRHGLESAGKLATTAGTEKARNRKLKPKLRWPRPPSCLVHSRANADDETPNSKQLPPLQGVVDADKDAGADHHHRAVDEHKAAHVLHWEGGRGGAQPMGLIADALS